MSDECVVSIIMPVRDECARIGAAVDAALAQDLEVPFEVIVADGMSRDGTREVLAARAARDERLRLVDNERGLTPCGLNVALAAARGRYVVRLDGHTIAPPDYARRLVAHLESGAWEAAGGIKRAVGETAFGDAVAAAFGSRFGMGNARHHYAGSAGAIDHVNHGAYVTERARAIGGFSEDLVRNQDYDFDWRYGAAGGRIFFDPTVALEWHVRETPGRLARQSFDYGYWKYVVLRRHPESLKLRWLVAPALVASIGVGAVLPGRRGRKLLRTVTTSYGVVLVAASAHLGRQVGAKRAPLVAAALATIHLSWGTGFLVSAASAARRRARTGGGS